MLVDQKTEGVVVPLNTSLQADGKLELANSTLRKGRGNKRAQSIRLGSLSEMAVLGASCVFIFWLAMLMVVPSV